MLSNLVIENIAIIEYASIDFTDGFNCLTGETGAGKSIIIDSINAVLGEKTSRDLIRTGESSARVSALFTDISSSSCSALDEAGIACEDRCIRIVRTLQRDGRNVCKINSVGVPVSTLKKIGITLINIHGQSDSQQLMQPQFHISFIDALASDSLLIKDYYTSYRKLFEIKGEIKKLTMDEGEKARRIDLLKYQTDEIEKAHIEEGETQILSERKNVINNYKSITDALVRARNALSGDGEFSGACSMLFDASSAVSEAASMSHEFEKTAGALNDIAYSAEDLASEINSFIESSSFDMGELQEIEDRLDVLFTLKKKYGPEESDVIEYYENAKKELESIELSDSKIEELKNEYERCYELTVQKAENLSKVRMKTAQEFERKVKSELETLDMPSVVFKVRRELCPFTPTGIDNIEFLISPNAGEEPKPLAKTASGGELSRIMLAIKSALAEKDDISTLIFDEIDTGVSGHAAGMIAKKLYSLSRIHQVLCITHLPVIASFADSHFEISKSTEHDKTFTHVHSLDFDGRKRAIARIVGGDSDDEIQLSSAQHMLTEAQKYKEATL